MQPALAAAGSATALAELEDAKFVKTIQRGASSRLHGTCLLCQSRKNWCTLITLERCKLGHRPPDNVIQAIRQATRSIVRAAAGSARKASFQLEALAPHSRVCKIPLESASLDAGGCCAGLNSAPHVARTCR
eukprot:2788972-Amphidinium_carterae.1